MPLSPGSRIGAYEIVGLLDTGGMGEVYRARDTRLDRMVAVKVLPDGVAASLHARERFQREAQAASALNHPNICTIYDVGADPPFIAMELLEGETLHRRLRRGPCAEAAIEFQKILDDRGIVGMDPVGALARLQLGRAFAASKNATKAKAAYSDFLELWKDAEPVVPVLGHARAEYARLQ